MAQICVIDAGYWSSKFKWSGGVLNFRSKVEKSTDILNSVNTWNVKLAGQNWLVGDGASDWNIEIDKTNNELYKIVIYTGLGLIRSTESFDLVVSYPLGSYNKENKQKFEEYLQTIDFIPVEINGVHQLIKVRKCTVFPQCVPVVYLGDWKNKIVGILDIGGLTVQGCIVDNLNIVGDSKFCENKGCIVMLNELKKILNRKYNLNIQDYEMNEIVKTGVGNDSLEIINEYLYNYVYNIKQIMRANRWNVDLIKMIFTGGGSLLLEKYLKEMFDGELSGDPVMDNANGLWKVGKIIYGED